MYGCDIVIYTISGVSPSHCGLHSLFFSYGMSHVANSFMINQENPSGASGLVHFLA